MHKKKYINFWMVVALVSGNMLGSGIFLLPSRLAQFGTISILAWILTTCGSLLLALVFCNLSSNFPKIYGGPHMYIEYIMGKFMGFQSAFGYWVSLWIGNCAISLSGVAYLSFFFPILENSKYAGLTSIIIIWLFISYNMLGARKVGWLQIISIMTKIVPLLFIILVGLWYIKYDCYIKNFNLTDNSNFQTLHTAASLTLWSFIGLESATVVSNKVQNPKRIIPLATFLGTLIASLIYIISYTVIMGIVPINDLITSNAPFALAATYIIGPKVGFIISITTIIACFGTLNGWIMIDTIVFNSIIGNRFTIFRYKNRFGVRIYSLILSGISMSTLLFFTITINLKEQFDFIILLSILTALIPYFYTTISNFLIIKKENSNTRLCNQSIIISILACIYSFWTILGAGQIIIYNGIILLLSSLPLYAILEWLSINKKNSSM